MDSVHVSQLSDRTEIRLSGRLVVSEVVDARRRLDAALRLKRPIVLNGIGVTGVDTAGLQLLLAFCTAARVRGLDLGWSQASAPLRDAAELLGLDPLLDMGDARDVSN